jgi:alkanesulfonate monooxygenase SsuD/methylene tetrahydromethanopterin reductase-like flavin-dependent oxidoreductase (luciferase family)
VCLPRLQAGYELGERDPQNFKLIIGPLTATGKDEAEVAAAWEKQRSMLGFLYSTPAYWPSLELFGWKDKGQQLLDMTRSGQWEEMPQIVTDEMLDRFVPRGDYTHIADVFRERYADLTSRVTFPMPDNPADDELVAAVIRQLQAG